GTHQRAGQLGVVDVREIAARAGRDAPARLLHEVDCGLLEAALGEAEIENVHAGVLLRARPTGRRCGIRDSCGAGDERQKSRMRLSEIAQRLDLELDGRHGDEAIEIRALAPIEDAGEGDLTFVAAARYRPLLASTKASAVILAAG